MARVLVLFGSFDGQAARIAQRVGSVISAAGHEVTVRSAAEAGAGSQLDSFDAVIVGGAIRYGRVARYLEALVREKAGLLESRRNAFFCVCLSAARPEGLPAAARCVEEFERRTGWRPRSTAIFAGALPYRRYNPILRVVMRFISGRAGGDTDASRDYEYTDWAAVERFATDFAAAASNAPSAR